MSIIKQLVEFDQKAGLTIYNLIKKKYNHKMISFDDNHLFSQYMFLNLVTILKEIGIEISEFIKNFITQAVTVLTVAKFAGIIF